MPEEPQNPEPQQTPEPQQQQPNNDHQLRLYGSQAYQVACKMLEGRSEETIMEYAASITSNAMLDNGSMLNDLFQKHVVGSTSTPERAPQKFYPPAGGVSIPQQQMSKQDVKNRIVEIAKRPQRGRNPGGLKALFQIYEEVGDYRKDHPEWK